MTGNTDHDLLIELRTDMKYILKVMDEEMQKGNQVHEDYEKRIRALETKNNRWVGKESLIGSIAGVAAGFLGGYFGPHH